MSGVTGCVSVAVNGVKGAVTVDRIIEYCHATSTTCTIWIDVFLTNRASDAPEILILHRGGFQGRDVTFESWVEPEGFEGALTRRIRALHASYLPISVRDRGTVTLNGIEYRVPRIDEPAYEVKQIIGGDASVRVPFTMWSLGLGRPGSVLFRMRLTMSAATFDSQIDRANGFTAYGESILLDKIESDDLPHCDYPDRLEYERRLRGFLSVDHVTPEAFEYLVISAEDSELPWQTTPLSSRIQQMSIGNPEFQRSTRWFVADTSNWLLSARSKPYRTFGLRVTRYLDDPSQISEPASVH